MQDVKYARAASVEEAIELLNQGGATARVLAGGTDIIVQARERRRVVDLLVAPPAFILSQDQTLR